MNKCPGCNRLVDPGGIVCSFCGLHLPAPSPETTASTAAPVIDGGAEVISPVVVDRSPARDAVQGPANALLVVGSFMILGNLYGLFNALTRSTPFQFGKDFPINLDPSWIQLIQTASSILGLALGGLVLFGALQMKKLENWGLALTASILSMIPCCSGVCCIIGLPIGIWALTILNKAEIKQHYQ